MVGFLALLGLVSLFTPDTSDALALLKALEELNDE